jgi:hypothetical protein
MPRRILQGGLAFIGGSAILIGLMFIGLGTARTAGLFNALLSFVHDGGPMKGVSHPNADSELRFYSVIWIGYGIVMVQTAQNLARHMVRVPFLLALFFGGGIARLISYLAVGQPHALFILLMVIELTLPLLLGGCFLKTRAQS